MQLTGAMLFNRAHVFGCACACSVAAPNMMGTGAELVMHGLWVYLPLMEAQVCINAWAAAGLPASSLDFGSRCAWHLWPDQARRRCTIWAS